MQGEEFKGQLFAIADRVHPASRARMREEVEALLAAGVDSFQQLLTLARNRRVDPGLRGTACWVLGRLGRKQAASTLLAVFNEGHPEVQGEAAISLGLLGSRRVVLPLIRALQTKIDPEARYFAAYALGHIDDVRAYEVLESTLLNGDEKPKVRGQAAEALAIMGAARAVPALLAAVEDPSLEVRFWSVYALGQVGGREVIPVLERLARTETAELPGWWPLSKEAEDAVEQIQRREGVGRTGNLSPDAGLTPLGGRRRVCPLRSMHRLESLRHRHRMHRLESLRHRPGPKSGAGFQDPAGEFARPARKDLSPVPGLGVLAVVIPGARAPWLHAVALPGRTQRIRQRYLSRLFRRLGHAPRPVRLGCQSAASSPHLLFRQRRAVHGAAR